MPNKQTHECTSHIIVVCPETKYLLDVKRAEMKRTMSSISYSQVIDQIINEWDEMKRTKAV